MLARQMHRRSLCECGQPREVAWHPAMEGWYQVAVYSCNACAAKDKVKPESHQRVQVRNSYDEQENGPLGSLPTVTFMDPEDLAVPTMNLEGGAAE
ncbi:MAG: hypothetical protein JWQ74_440 [Marmoricola sp.]|nr:hypothetical protein [Marmoricola sp.]